MVFRNLMSSQTSSSLDSEAGVGRAAASPQTQAADRGNLVLRRRRRRRRKFPKQKLFKHPRPGGQKIHFTKKVGPYKLWDNDLNYNDFDDTSGDDYIVDFYEDKNYEYIDQEDSESMTFDQLDENDIYKMKFNFKNIDYDNYEYEEVGVLNFRETTTTRKPDKYPNTNKKISKRKIPLKHHYSQERVPPRRKLFKRRLRHNASVKKSSVVDGLQSTFDMSSLITIGGLWVIWQIYLVRLRSGSNVSNDCKIFYKIITQSGTGIIPSTSLGDLWNNIGNFGRTSEDHLNQLVAWVEGNQDNLGLGDLFPNKLQ